MKQWSLRRKRRLFLAFLLLSPLYTIPLGAIFNNLPPKVLASGSTVVAIDPPISTANPDQYFTVNVTITDVTDLYSWAARISWPAGLLSTHKDNVTEGPFLQVGGTTDFTKKAYLSYIDIGSMLLGAVPGVNGSGTLATVIFKALKGGNCTIKFDPVRTTLYDPAFDLIDRTLHDGVFYTTRPVARFTYTPHPMEYYGRPIVGETVTFDGTLSYDPDDPYDATPGGILSYEWDFGDDTTGTGSIATHVYNESGSFTVTLTVIDDEGESDIIDRPIIGDPFITIQYHDIAVINVTVTPTTFTPGATLTINVTVLNKGSVSETLNVTVYQNVNPVNTTLFRYLDVVWIHGVPSFTWTAQLEPEENATATIEWDTAGVYPSDYTLGVYAYLVYKNLTTSTWESVPGIEKDEVLLDNWMFYGTVTATGEEEHDIAVVDIKVAPIHLKIGGSSNIEVTIKNEGNVDEQYNATITISYGSELFRQKKWSNQSLSAGTTEKLEFKYWVEGANATKEGEYNVTVVVILVNKTTLEEVPDDHPADNTRSVQQDIDLFPVPYFTYSPAAPRVDELVTFNASASYTPGIPGGTINTYRWDFGDGTKLTATTSVITHVFRRNMTFTVKLEVTDDALLASNTTKSLSVSAFGNIAITNVAFSPHNATSGESISINVTVTARLFQENCEVTTYFGDNEIGTQSVTVLIGIYETLLFTWNTTGVTRGSYTIKAIATTPTPPEEITFIGGMVTLNGLPGPSGALSLAAFPASFIVGTTTTMNGTISPAQAGVEIAILYRLFDEETWSTLVVVVTAEGGVYSYPWTPTNAGTYAVKSSWQARASESEVQIVIVQEEEVSSPNIFLFTTIALAALAVAIGVISIYLIRRKPKS